MQKLFIALLMLPAWCLAETSTVSEEIVLKTTKSQCQLILPKGLWELESTQSKSDGTVSYYHYWLKDKPVNFSVYIDENNSCTDSAKCLDIALTNQTYKNPLEVKKYQSNGFETAEVLVDLKKLVGATTGNVGVLQLNMVAEKYENGCWYDVHLSTTTIGKNPPASTDLISILEKLKTRKF